MINGNNIQQILLAAQSKAKTSITECDSHANSYFQRNALYRKLSFGGVMAIIGCVLEIVFAISFHFVGYKHLDEFCETKLHLYLGKIGSIIRFSFFDTAFLLLAAFLFTLLFRNLFERYYTIKEKRTVKRFHSYSKDMKEAADQMPKYSEEIANAMEKGEDYIIKSVSSVDTQYIALKDQAENKIKQSANTKKIIKTASCAIITLLFGFILTASVAENLMLPGNMFIPTIYYSSFVVMLSYIVIFTTLLVDMKSLSKYYGKTVRIIAIVFAVLFQVAVGLRLYLNGSVNVIIEYGKSDPSRWLFNFQILTVLLTTIMMLIGLALVDWQKMFNNEDVIIPMQGSNDIRVSSKSVRSKTIWFVILGMIYAFVCSRWLSHIINGGWSFGGVVLFFVVGGLWVGVSMLFDNNEIEIKYGSFGKWIKPAVFSVYALMTISMIPSFGIGAVVLLAINYVFIFVVALILSFI